MRTIAWQDNTRNSFTAKAVVKRQPENHHLLWVATFTPNENEPWNHYENWKFTFTEDQAESSDDFWLPLGRWRATANDNPNLSDTSRIELLLDGSPIAELTAPNQSVTFNTRWDNGGNTQRLTAQMSGMTSDLVSTEVSLYYEAQFDLTGQLPQFTQLDDLFLVSYLESWGSPAGGVITLRPVLYDDAGHMLAQGPQLTMTVTGDGGGGQMS